MRRLRDEEGSILPMTVVIVAVVLTFSAFAVDLGLARVARQDMQSLSDAVALDMARKMNGRTVTQIEVDPAWEQAKEMTIARNNATVGADPEVELVLGFVDEATGQFSEAAPGDRPNAVRAIAATTVGFSFVQGEAETSRSAIARLDPAACFSVGSFAASLASSDSPLLSLVNEALGINLTVLSADGIATLREAEVPLLALASELNVGGAEELLDADVTLGQFAAALATVLNQSGNTVAAELLNSAIGSKVNAVPGTFKIGEILDLGAGEGAALDVGANVLELVGAGLLVASQGNAVTLPASITIPLIATLEVSLKIIEPPQIACGRPGEATARAAQVELSLDGEILKVVSGVINPRLSVDIGVAAASGTLASIECGSSTTGHQISVDATSGLVTTDVEVALRVLLGGSVKIEVGPGMAAQRDESIPLVFEPPPSTALPSGTISGQLSSLGLAGLSPRVTTSGLIGGLLGGILSGLLTPVLGAVDTLLTPALNPILKLLGVELGGAEVVAAGRPSCDAPKLVG